MSKTRVVDFDLQVLLQAMVGRGGDSRLSRAAEIDRYAIRLLMVDRPQNSFSRIHGWIRVRRARM